MATAPPRIFDRRAYARHRERGARRHGDAFLATEAASGLAERLAAVNRTFARALDLGSRHAAFSLLQPLAKHWTRASLARSDLSAMSGAIADEEALPFAAQSFDLVTSVLSLHAVNDLPGALIQIRRVLKPDGLFLAALFAGDTLSELRGALAAGESEIAGGLSPRVAPFADVRDLGGLLQRAGLALPVADMERTTVRYKDINRLFADLRTLGETNALSQRDKRGLSRPVLSASLAHYAVNHADPDGRLRATFDIVYLTGWAPHESQQKPLAPGSALASLADALKKESSSGD
ncbi:MAG TPA: methyltransferase domain-containing protein [Rhizomicrobium sp.]|jgi:SAM-dependent methyltransferase|nr:methyltransferase domain-containing protein [Rhizomicrobium sp.]